jgi:hypothetical protein
MGRAESALIEDAVDAIREAVHHLYDGKCGHRRIQPDCDNCAARAWGVWALDEAEQLRQLQQVMVATAEDAVRRLLAQVGSLSARERCSWCDTCEMQLTDVMYAIESWHERSD